MRYLEHLLIGYDCVDCLFREENRITANQASSKNVPYYLFSRLSGERRFFNDWKRQESDSGRAGIGKQYKGTSAELGIEASELKAFVHRQRYSILLTSPIRHNIMMTMKQGTRVCQRESLPQAPPCALFCVECVSKVPEMQFQRLRCVVSILRVYCLSCNSALLFLK